MASSTSAPVAFLWLTFVEMTARIKRLSDGLWRLLGMSLAEELRAILHASGADMVGFANLQHISPDVLSYLPFGISIAVALRPQIILQIQDGPTREYFTEYERANHLLNRLGRLAAQFLRENGQEAQWFAATYAEELRTILRAGSDFDPEILSTRLPHKTTATRAGLGWIGKCALLVTKTFGSAIRLSTVLTDAMLPSGDSQDISLCGDCASCVMACPGHAPSGKNWQPDLPRGDFFDAFACQRAAKQVMTKRTGIDYPLCGICIAACPWTQRYITTIDRTGT
jgi:epoxyqueuosine reductase QueG